VLHFSASNCDCITLAKNAANLDRIVHILSFYWRHKLRKPIEKFLDVLFISSSDKVDTLFIIYYYAYAYIYYDVMFTMCCCCCCCLFITIIYVLFFIILQHCG
jgi:hypothetical protein